MSKRRFFRQKKGDPLSKILIYSLTYGLIVTYTSGCSGSGGDDDSGTSTPIETQPEVKTTATLDGYVRGEDGNGIAGVNITATYGDITKTCQTIGHKEGDKDIGFYSLGEIPKNVIVELTYSLDGYITYEEAIALEGPFSKDATLIRTPPSGGGGGDPDPPDKPKPPDDEEPGI